MPYVMRDSTGKIVGLFSSQTQEAVEHLGSGHPDVRAFLREGEADRNELSATDKGMARVSEDLIELLMAKNVINFTDFPQEAQKKLLARRKMRSGGALDLGLVGDGEVL